MIITTDQTCINLCEKCTQENCCWNIAKGCRDFTPQPQPPVEPEANEETTMWDDTCKKIKVPVAKKTAHAPVKQIKCRGIEIEPGVFSGCDTKGGTLKDCPICKGAGYETGPDCLSPVSTTLSHSALLGVEFRTQPAPAFTVVPPHITNGCELMKCADWDKATGRCLYPPQVCKYREDDTPTFTVEEIANWMETIRGIFDLDDCKNELIKMLNDPSDGINAVTRKGG